MILETVLDDGRFDTLIVDEPQDFDAEWFDIQRLLLKEAPRIVWFEGRDQDIRYDKEAGRGIEEAFSHLGFVTFNSEEIFFGPDPG